MEKRYYLTDADLHVLKWLKEHAQKSRLNQYPPDLPPEYDQGSPEVYVALTPSGGIPARTGTVTLTAGYEECALFKINRDSYEIEPLLNPDASPITKEKVFNFYSTKVDGNIYIKIIRDKSGRWLCEQPPVPAGIPFKNVSGETVPPYGIMWETDSDTIGGSDYLLTEKPSQTFDRLWLVNGSTAIANNGFGIGSRLSEAGKAAINSDDTPATKSGWGPKPGSFLLHRYWLGFTMLGTNTTTVNGQLVGDFKQHEVKQVIGLFYDQIDQGESGLFEIMHRRGDEKPKMLGFDKITVWDMMMNKNDKIKKKTKGSVLWNGDFWEIVNAYCDPANTDDVSSTPSQINNDTNQAAQVSSGNSGGLSVSSYDNSGVS